MKAPQEAAAPSTKDGAPSSVSYRMAMMFGPMASGDMVALLVQQVSRRVRLAAWFTGETEHFRSLR